MAPHPPLNDERRPQQNRRHVSGGRRSDDRLQIHFAALTESADDAIISETLDGQIESWNRGAERVFGYTAEEIVGQPTAVLTPPERQHEEEKLLEHVRRGETIDRYETVRMRKDGSRVLVSLTVSPMKDSRGRVAGVSRIARDITENRQAEQRLRESETRYRELFESSRDAILSSDMEGRLTGANPAALEMLGYTLDELRQLTYRQLTPERWQGKGCAIVQDQIKSRGYSDEYEKEYLRKDGSVVPVSIRAWLIKNRDEPPAGMWVLVRDITERKRVEERLHESQVRWRNLFEHAPIPIWEEDYSAVRARFDELQREGVDDLGDYLTKHPEETRRLAGLVKILDMSQATLDTFNVSRLDELPRSLLDYFDAESLAVFRQKMAALWAGQRQFAAETRIRDPAGQPRLLDARLCVVPGFEQSLARVLVSFVDTTERRRTEEALRESEERFRGLAEGMPHIVWETDARGVAIYHNRVWYDYTRRAPESSLGNEYLKDFHPDERDYVLAEWAWSVRTEGAHAYDVEARIRRYDGVYRWFRIKGAPIRNGAGKIVRWAGTCTDIEDQKRAAERLEFAQVAGEVGFFDYDFTTDQSVWSEGLARLFGIELKSYEKTWEGWAKRVFPEDFAAVQAKVHERIRRRAQHVDFEFRAVLPDGTHRWLAGRGRLAYDAAGNPVRMTGMNVDISERKRLEKELEERAQELAEADRRKDEFLATLAHELRNPLAPIRTSAAIVRTSAGANARLQWAAEAILRQVQHLDHLVGDLLDLARIAQGKISLSLEPCDLRTIVSQAIEMNRDAIEAKNQPLRLDLPAWELPFRCDRARLVQVVSNLINNAVKYTPAGGDIELTAARENETVALHVRDTGTGIDPELLPYVFDLFVQGKRDLARTEGGLGIGLTLVKKITELHGGQVSVANRSPGPGAEITVRLPPWPAEAPGGEPRTAIYPKARAPRRILIVEDNQDAADSLAFLLGDLGHDVQVAYDGNEGLKKGLEFLPDIAIIDIGLPGISGYELARRFRQEPRLRRALLIAVSGYGQWSDREQSRAAGFDHHLIKPADPDELNSILSGRVER